MWYKNIIYETLFFAFPQLLQQSSPPLIAVFQLFILIQLAFKCFQQENKTTMEVSPQFSNKLDIKLKY